MTLLSSHRRLRLVSVLLGAAVLVAACGGSGGDNAGTAGVVVGSYFRNALVCLDRNANGRCDTGEPSARTDDLGRFTLDGAGAGVVAEIGTDAQQYAPTTRTATAVAQRMVLRAPADAPGVVSFLSTAVVAEMESGPLGFAAARTQVAQAVGVPADRLLTDFNTEPDAPVRAALQASSDDGLQRIRTALQGVADGTDVRALVAAASRTARYYQTKAPYRPQQEAASYEAAPAGYAPVFTQLLARHGSRGLSSLKYDLAVYNLWKQAQAEGALTPLGARLGPDVLRIMKANFLLGYGVDGISTPGYGNETQVGIDEHTRLAQRMLARLPGYWKQVGDAAASAPRQIVAVTSGQDRAVDSGAFFVRSLAAVQPALAPLVTRPPAPAPSPDTGAAVPQPAGTDRFLLYFHKLVKATDAVARPADPRYTTYQDSQAYQAYKGADADLLALQAGLLATPEVQAAGRAALARLFTPAFVEKVASGSARFANTGSQTFASTDGKFSATLEGDGKTRIASAADAGALLYELYVIAPAMRAEAGVDFSVYLAPEQARVFAAANDASDFYDKGPGIAEKGDVTYRMAQILVDDFFAEGDAIARGRLAHAAKLRFAHAEIAIPFATRMGLKNAVQQQPKAQVFRYAANPWRGDEVSPMAANMQWDMYRSSTDGRLLVKMLYNEKETDFKAACDGAKIGTTSHFYDYAALRRCYGYPALAAQ